MKIRNYKFDCKFFNGYKPCKFNRENCKGCENYQKIKYLILIINLDALGDVLMTTATLPAIKRKYPESFIIWLTEKNAVPLLENNHLIDKIMTWDWESYLILKNMKFDIVFNADKSIRSSAFAMEMNARLKKGFKINRFGAILPFDKDAYYDYYLGLNNKAKFKENQLTGQEILAKTFGVEYSRDEYILNLSEEQKRYIREYKLKNNISENDIVVGFNTGCSSLYPNKKFEIEHILYIINRIHKEFPEVKIALFGGKDEKERNEFIAKSLNFNIINTPTDEGLRKGIAVMDIADIIVTGDTLGMHIGIGLKKEIIVWFNVSCAAEIDLYNRGVKILSDVPCSPCWKRECDSLLCLKNIDLEKIYNAIKQSIEKLKLRKNLK